MSLKLKKLFLCIIVLPLPINTSDKLLPFVTGVAFSALIAGYFWNKQQQNLQSQINNLNDQLEQLKNQKIQQKSTKDKSFLLSDMLRKITVKGNVDVRLYEGAENKECMIFSNHLSVKNVLVSVKNDLLKIEFTALPDDVTHRPVINICYPYYLSIFKVHNFANLDVKSSKVENKNQPEELCIQMFDKSSCTYTTQKNYNKAKIEIYGTSSLYFAAMPQLSELQITMRGTSNNGKQCAAEIVTYSMEPHWLDNLMFKSDYAKATCYINARKAEVAAQDHSFINLAEIDSGSLKALSNSTITATSSSSYKIKQNANYTARIELTKKSE